MKGKRWLFLFLIYVIYLLLRYKKSRESASYGENKTHQTKQPTPVSPPLGKKPGPSKPENAPPHTALKTKARRSNTSLQTRKARHDRNQANTRQNPSAATRTNEKNLTAASADREERIKLLLPNLKRRVTRTPNRTATWAGYISTRQKPGGGGTSDISMGQGGSAIP